MWRSLFWVIKIMWGAKPPTSVLYIWMVHSYLTILRWSLVGSVCRIVPTEHRLYSGSLYSWRTLVSASSLKASSSSARSCSAAWNPSTSKVAPPSPSCSKQWNVWNNHKNAWYITEYYKLNIDMLKMYHCYTYVKSWKKTQISLHLYIWYIINLRKINYLVRINVILLVSSTNVSNLYLF